MFYELPLTKGKVTKLDFEVFMMLAGFKEKWSMNGPYAFNRKFGLLHRFLMKAKKGQMVDHINGDPLDNRHCNLRFCTNSTNQANRRKITGKSKFKGVCWDRGKWLVRIRVNTKLIYLGVTATDIEGAELYNKAAKKYFGDFAWINDLDESKISDLVAEPILEQPRKARSNGTSKYRGVSYDKSRGKWMAQLKKANLKKRFATEIEAAKAYDDAAKFVFGPKVLLNFLI